MTAQNRLAGKVAIVTGSGAGIGRAEATLFAAQGAKVVVNDIAVKNGTPIAQLVVEQIRATGGRCRRSRRREQAYASLLELMMVPSPHSCAPQ